LLPRMNSGNLGHSFTRCATHRPPAHTPCPWASRRRRGSHHLYMPLAPLRVTPPPPRPLHVHVHVGRSPHTTKTSATATFSDSSGASKLEDTSYNRLAGCGLGAACHGGGAPPIRGMGSCAALSRSRPRPYSSFPEATTAGSSSHGLRPGQETCRRPACRGAYAR